MKKAIVVIIFVLIISLLSVGPAAAQKGKINIKGEVTAIGDGTLTVQSNKGDTYVFRAPEGFDLSTIQVGDSVLVKATAGEDGTWQSDSIKQIGQGSGEGSDENEMETEGEGDTEKKEGFKDNSAFCAGDKQGKPHPLAPKIAERYGVSEETVMGYFCEGYSIGAIMLAIKTSQLEGMSVDVGTLLAGRASGNAWGQIWKELGLIGNEKDGHSPPGQLKKPDHAGPKDK